MKRRILPQRRPSATIETEWEGHAISVTVGLFPDTGEIGEVFADTLKGGAIQSSIADACVLISLALQHGVALPDLGKSLARVPLTYSDGDAPASPVGAVVAAMMGFDL